MLTYLYNMRNAKQNIMNISAKFLAKKLFISYAKEQLAKGKTENEIKKSLCGERYVNGKIVGLNQCNKIEDGEYQNWDDQINNCKKLLDNKIYNIK